MWQVDDSLYFMCNINDFKFLADMIQHVPLPLRARYVFCCAPISRKATFVCSMFLKFARQYSRNEAITFNWLSQQIGWPLACPNTITHLVHLEAVFDVLDLYLWLSYRFPVRRSFSPFAPCNSGAVVRFWRKPNLTSIVSQDLFPHGDTIRDMQSELDSLIQSGVAQMTRLLINSENSVSSGVSTAVDVDDSGVAKARPYYRQSLLLIDIFFLHIFFCAPFGTFPADSLRVLTDWLVYFCKNDTVNDWVVDCLWVQRRRAAERRIRNRAPIWCRPAG